MLEKKMREIENMEKLELELGIEERDMEVCGEEGVRVLTKKGIFGKKNIIKKKERGVCINSGGEFNNPQNILAMMDQLE